MAKKIDPQIKVILKKMVDAEIIGLLKQKNLSILFEVSQSVISELLLEIKSEHISNKVKKNLSKAQSSQNPEWHFVWNYLIGVINQHVTKGEKLYLDANVDDLYNKFLLPDFNTEGVIYRNIFDIVIKYLNIYHKDYHRACTNLLNYVYDEILNLYPDKFSHAQKMDAKANTLLKEIHKVYSDAPKSSSTDILCKIILKADDMALPNDTDIVVRFLKIYPERYAYLNIDVPNMITFVIYNTLLHFIFTD